MTTNRSEVSIRRYSSVLTAGRTSDSARLASTFDWLALHERDVIHTAAKRDEPDEATQNACLGAGVARTNDQIHYLFESFTAKRARWRLHGHSNALQRSTMWMVVAFYTTHFGFVLLSQAGQAFADVMKGDLRLLLSGPASSAGRRMPDGRQPIPGGWNRIQLVVEDIGAEVDRLRAEGLTFRNEIVKGPGGSQILLDDPSANPIELFQPAQR
jgi:catechol 2,3-dioxygenase-like lactoylglutathione lyase family enzyme